VYNDGVLIKVMGDVMKEMKSEKEIVELLEISKNFVGLVETKYNNQEISKNEYNYFVDNKISFIRETNLITNC
jgi:hypothetical protein